MKQKMFFIRRWRVLLVLVSILLGGVSFAAETAVPANRRPAFVPGELLVKYKASVPEADRIYHRNLRGIFKVRSFKRIGVDHIKLPDNLSVADAMALYSADPQIEIAEPNYYLYASGIPNDTDFENLWGLNNSGQTVESVSGTFDADMDAAEAWDITTGSESVIVAVIDSGADFNHPDLAANIWINTGETPGDGIDNDGNGYVDDIRGWDFIDDDNNPMDPDGHGTHVAGTIGAMGDNGIGVAGVAWDVQLMILKFLDATGSGTTADAISAINYAGAKGAHIINCSWGGPENSSLLEQAINASPALVVCAAGNSAANSDLAPEYPASFSCGNIVSVAATDQNDELAWFSNFGLTSVDVGAPGANIYSTLTARQTLTGFPDNLNDISGWTTGGTHNSWAATGIQPFINGSCLTDSPGIAAFYQNNTDSWARAPMLDLTSHAAAVLEFQLRGSSQPNEDYLSVETSTDLAQWTPMLIGVKELLDYRISGRSLNDGWYTATVDLGFYDGQPAVYFRFRFTTNAVITDDGWYIDDVMVTSATTGEAYAFQQGTSMAAPHVAGLAALIKARNPSYTHTQIKAVIENSGDALPALNGKTGSGRRINAYSALTPQVPVPPSNLSADDATATTINLTWTDNSGDEAGFEIERKNSDAGTFSQIDTTQSGITYYQDTGLSQGTAYTYRIRAFNGSGDSAYSNEASATTSVSSGSSGGGGCFIGSAR